MILHILPDDKFVDSFCKTAMRVAPSGTEQVFAVRDPQPYRYLPNDTDYLVNAPFNSEAFTLLTRAAKKGDRIVIHFFHPYLRNWLAGFETQASMEWILWSSDFYTWNYWHYNEYLPATEAFVNRSENQRLSRYWPLHLYRKAKKTIEHNRRRKSFEAIRDAAVKKINVFHHFIEDEYRQIQKFIPIKATFNYFYYSIDNPLNQLAKLVETESLNFPFSQKPYLIVGHCGYPYVNHLDSFLVIKNKLNTEINIVAPLSYGKEDYMDHVKKKGEEYFGENFFALESYLSFNQYLAFLNMSNGLVLDLTTPKALGNIHTALVLGKRVFLNKQNMVCHYLDELDIAYNKVDEITQEMVLTPPDPTVVESNIKTLLGTYTPTRHDEVIYQFLTLKTL